MVASDIRVPPRDRLSAEGGFEHVDPGRAADAAELGEDADLFAATWAQRYPDALARVRLALGGVTGNHDGLSSTQSLGFAAVTEDGDDPWGGEPALRPAQVFRPWAPVVRAGRDGAR